MNTSRIFLLPGYSKYIGFLINLISIVLIGVFLLSGTKISAFFSQSADIKIYAIYAMLVFGCVLITFSREKVEDEFVNYLRLKSFFISVILHSLFFFVFAFTNLTLVMVNFPAIILMDSILLVYIILFYTYKIKELQNKKE